MATIREKGYYHWDGQLVERRFPWWPITRTGIQLAFKQEVVQVRLRRRLRPGRRRPRHGLHLRAPRGLQVHVPAARTKLIAVDPKFFMNFLTNGGLALHHRHGPRLRRRRASSPTTSSTTPSSSISPGPSRKKDYLLGKMAVIFFFVLLLTLVPALVLVPLQAHFRRELQLRPRLSLAPPLGRRLLGRPDRLLRLLHAPPLGPEQEQPLRHDHRLHGLSLLADPLRHREQHPRFHGPGAALLSIYENLQQVAAFLFGQKPPHAVPPAGPSSSWPPSAPSRPAVLEQEDPGRRGHPVSAVIEAKNLSKWYGNVLGLSDVSLEIESGHHRPARARTAPASRPS